MALKAPRIGLELAAALILVIGLAAPAMAQQNTPEQLHEAVERMFRLIRSDRETGNCESYLRRMRTLYDFLYSDDYDLKASPHISSLELQGMKQRYSAELFKGCKPGDSAPAAAIEEAPAAGIEETGPDPTDTDPRTDMRDYRNVASDKYKDPASWSKDIRKGAELYKKAMIEAREKGDGQAIALLKDKFRRLNNFARERADNMGNLPGVARSGTPEEALDDYEFVLGEWAEANKPPKETVCQEGVPECEPLPPPCDGDSGAECDQPNPCEEPASMCYPSLSDCSEGVQPSCEPTGGLTGISVVVADVFGIEGLRIIPAPGIVIRVLDPENQEVTSVTTSNTMAAYFIKLEPGTYSLKLDIGKYKEALPPHCTNGYLQYFELPAGSHIQFAASVYSAVVAADGKSVGTVTGDCIRRQ